jgi:hypothetical protein
VKAVREALIWSAVLALIVTIVMPMTIHRFGFNQAFIVWFHNPSATNEAEFHRQRHINQIEELKTRGVAGLGMFAVFASALLTHSSF